MRKIRFANLLIFIKKRALLCFLAAYCLLPADSSAQGNLQFNQVIVFDIPLTSSQAIAVPAGKVWKIESVGIGQSGTVPSILLRNSSGVGIAHFASTASTFSSAFPYWLSSGFVGSFYNNHFSLSASVSIIEFNVVP